MNIWECSDGKACSLKSSDAEKTIYDIKKQHIKHSLLSRCHLHANRIIIIRKNASCFLNQPEQRRIIIRDHFPDFVLCPWKQFHHSMKMTPDQQTVFDMMRKHGVLTDDYYDLTKQREKVREAREQKENRKQ